MPPKSDLKAKMKEKLKNMKDARGVGALLVQHGANAQKKRFQKVQEIMNPLLLPDENPEVKKVYNQMRMRHARTKDMVKGTQKLSAKLKGELDQYFHNNEVEIDLFQKAVEEILAS